MARAGAGAGPEHPDNGSIHSASDAVRTGAFISPRILSQALPALFGDTTLDVATFFDWDKGFDIGLAAGGGVIVTGRTLNPATFSGDETTIKYVEP